MIPSRSHVPTSVGVRTSGAHLAVDATDGVRKNTTRGVRNNGPFARTKPGESLRYRSERRWQHRRTRRDCDQPARHHRKVMQPDEEYVGFPSNRVASAQELDTARSALHRPTRDRGQRKDGANAIATVRKRGATVMQGIINARSDRKE